MVIDVDKIICELEEKGLKISDKEKLTYYIKNFNVNTFLADYSDFFINEQGNFDQGVNSEDIIRLYIFDKNLGVHVFKCLLIIEKMINTSLVYATINVYDIKDKCLLNLDENVIKNDVLRNLDKVEPYTEFKPFLYKYTKYLDSNKNIKKLVIKDEPDNIYKWKNVPLDLMCLTWSFAMTFSFFIASSMKIKETVMENLGIKKEYYAGFVDLIKNFINIRNHISHNIVLYDSEVKYATDELSDLYYFVFKHKVLKQQFRLIHLIKFISVLSNDATLFDKTMFYVKKLQITEPFKEQITNLFDI